MSFVAGSIGDIRIPAIQMAQKASKTEASTPQGDVMAALGVSASVVVSFVIVTIFTFIGTAVILFCIFRYGFDVFLPRGIFGF